MKAFITGGTGFIGGRVARLLRDRGDEVVALVRSKARAGELAAMGCELVEGDLSSEDAIREAVKGCDAVFHIGAVYKVGIPASEHAAMFDANVRGTERVLDAAIEAGVPKIVYVSTVGIFGNTHEQVVDETFSRPDEGYRTYYEETKCLAHQVALDRIAAGAPIVIVQPGGVYGPGDHSEIGNIIDQVRTGKLKLEVFGDLGMCLVHVDDVADGVVRAHDRGTVGEAYVLGGEVARLRDLIGSVAELSGRKPPRRAMPVALMKAVVPIGPLVGRVMGFPPNLGELIRGSDGVTLWASSAKAERELGYHWRPLDEGLRELLAA